VEAWLGSVANADPRCHLVFVGALAEDDFGAALRARAAMHIHTPAHTGARMHAVIEAFYATSQGMAEQRLVQALARIDAHPSEGDRVQAAASIAANRLPRAARQVLVDLTHVTEPPTAPPAVAVLLRTMIATAPAGWRIEPVRHDGKRFRYPRRLTLDLIGRNDVLIEDAVADAGAGDLFLHIDPTMPLLFPSQWDARGVQFKEINMDDDVAEAVRQLLAPMA
jgi:hypothetical protein